MQNYPACKELILLIFIKCVIWASTRENLSLVFANNKGADQPVHPHRLISPFVIRFLQSVISKLATDEFSIFYLVSVAEETGLGLALSDTPKDRFCRDAAHISISIFRTSTVTLNPIVLKCHDKDR